MAREKNFNMRVSEEEEAILAQLANHYGLTASGVIRMLLRKERAVLAMRDPTVERFEDEHGLVLDLLTDWFGQDRKPIRLADIHADGRVLEVRLPMYPDAKFSGGLGRIFNELRRWGYVKKESGGYVPTAKALAWAKGESVDQQT